MDSLLPGNVEDPIRISIHHTSFIPSSNSRSKQSSTNKLQNKVPYPWSAEETDEGDTIFFEQEHERDILDESFYEFDFACRSEA